MENKRTFKFNDEELYFNIGLYPNKRIAITCDTLDEPYSDITINLPNKYIDSVDKIYIDPFIKEIGLQDALIKDGIVEEIISSENYNFGMYDLVKINFEKLKEYDSIELENVLNDIGYVQYIEESFKMWLT